VKARPTKQGINNSSAHFLKTISFKGDPLASSSELEEQMSAILHACR